MQLTTARNRSAAVVCEKSLKLCVTLRSKRAKTNPIVILMIVPNPIQLIIQTANVSEVLVNPRIHLNRQTGGRGGKGADHARVIPMLASKPVHLQPEPLSAEAESEKQKSLGGRNDYKTFQIKMILTLRQVRQHPELLERKKESRDDRKDFAVMQAIKMQISFHPKSLMTMLMVLLFDRRSRGDVKFCVSWV